MASKVLIPPGLVKKRSELAIRSATSSMQPNTVKLGKAAAVSFSLSLLFLAQTTVVCRLGIADNDL